MNFAIEEIRKLNLNGEQSNQIQGIEMDLSSFSSVRNAATTILNADIPIHTCILNAGKYIKCIILYTPSVPFS